MAMVPGQVHQATSILVIIATVNSMVTGPMSGPTMTSMKENGWLVFDTGRAPMLSAMVTRTSVSTGMVKLTAMVCIDGQKGVPTRVRLKKDLKKATECGETLIILRRTKVTFHAIRRRDKVSFSGLQAIITKGPTNQT